jgi:hypothetical protein
MVSGSRSWLAGWGVILIFWMIVGAGKFPPPWCDDAFFIGAAINLAQHNIFSNPLCEALPDYGSTTYFFSALPLHSYVLAAWLKVFGVSTFSFHLYSVLVAFAATVAIYRFFPDSPVSWLYAFFCCLAVFCLLGGTGLRMDGLALLFLVLGLGVCWSRSVGMFFLGNLLLALDAITLPSIGLIALLVSGSVFLYRYLYEGKKNELRSLFWAMVAAYGLAFILFLWCIDGRVGEFVFGMMKNQQVASKGIEARFHLFDPAGLAKWVIPQGCFLLLLALCRKEDSDRQVGILVLGVALAGYLLLAFASFSSALAPHIWVFACLVTALWLIARESWGARALLPWAIVFVIATYGHSHVAVEDCLADPPVNADQKEEILSRLKEMHVKRIYVDAYALREVYDYRLPDNVYSYEWSLPIRQGYGPDLAVAIVSAKNASNVKRGDTAPLKPKPLSIFGYCLKGTYKNPYDLVILEDQL